jgi:adenosylcobinamide-phosphate synthase
MSTDLRRAEAAGLLAGAAADALLGDPRPGHPVALFGRLAQASERVLWRPARTAGALHVLLLASLVLALSRLALRLARAPRRRALLTAAAAWVSLGGTTLGREAEAMARSLERGEIAAARRRLPHLCSRDPEALDASGISLATVESVAENTSDAVVAPLLYGAAAGVPGLLVYRAINTLDAMVGYRSERYRRFGWAAARLDDLANLLPARLTCALAALLAPIVAGSARAAVRCWRQDGAAHESPNAGPVKAAFAGALGLRLGGPVRYPHGLVERPSIGEGRDPQVADIRGAVRLSRAVGLAGLALALAARAAAPRRRSRSGP